MNFDLNIYELHADLLHQLALKVMNKMFNLQSVQVMNVNRQASEDFIWRRTVEIGTMQIVLSQNPFKTLAVLLVESKQSWIFSKFCRWNLNDFLHPFFSHRRIFQHSSNDRLATKELLGQDFGQNHRLLLWLNLKVDSSHHRCCRCFTRHWSHTP